MSMNDLFANGSADLESRASVLVVDDNREAAGLLCKQLRQLGFAFETAYTGQEAIDLFLKNKFSCILMDLQMPVMDGYETTRKIRNLEGVQRILIIAVSAGAVSECKQKYLDAGMDDYLPKPVSTQRLEEALSRRFPRKSITDY